MTALRSFAASAPPHPFAPGALIAGKYRVERELAEGGLGIVVIATQIALNRRVAIKYLKEKVLGNADIVERFQREAQLAAAIRSDHVVRVFDVGSLPDVGPYMVMEYLEGEDLGGVLANGPLLPEIAIDYVIQACDALAEAHSLGIVHRDLKPENLFLTRRVGTIPILKILDFGISKVNEAKIALANGSARVRRMTAANDRFGTPLYMSPEQLRSTSSVDARSDIWSLGVVLFELLTGELPFAGDSIPELGANIMTAAPVALRTRLPVASAPLEAIVTKCLAKDPAHRYRNVAELVDELVQVATPASQPRRHRIRQVVLESGASIRPPRSLRTSAPTELPAVTISPPRAPRTAFALATAAIALLGLVVGIAVVCLRLREPVITTSTAGSIVQMPAAAPEPRRELVPEPTAVFEIPSTPHVAPTASSEAPVRTRARPPAAEPPPKAATPPAPEKTKSDYSEFGDRG